ncbi:clathrin light chain A isoform X2 [Strix uralensis]|uniref:clathrin light chain A isoform X2 n=1 Tax=Strix uralensis TaxID=36305 RepID=UPI003DA7A391
MADLELFGTQQQPATAADNGALDGAEEDPAAAFLAQQENEIAGIENDEGYSILESGEVPAALHVLDGFVSGAVDGVINGDVYKESNGPTDSCAAISQVERLQSEPESIHKWREEQKERLEHLDVNSRKQEAEWKEKAIKELEDWYARQDEKLQKTKASNRVADEAFYKQPFADVIGYVTNINHPCYSLEQVVDWRFGEQEKGRLALNCCSSTGLEFCLPRCSNLKQTDPENHCSTASLAL